MVLLIHLGQGTELDRVAWRKVLGLGCQSLRALVQGDLMLLDLGPEPLRVSSLEDLELASLMASCLALSLTLSLEHW